MEDKSTLSQQFRKAIKDKVFSGNFIEFATQYNANPSIFINSLYHNDDGVKAEEANEPVKEDKLKEINLTPKKVEKLYLGMSKNTAIAVGILTIVVIGGTVYYYKTKKKKE